MFIGTSWQIFLTTSDPARYQCYTLAFWLGSDATKMLPADQCQFLRSQLPAPQPPFHILPFEYPPLTLLPFTLAMVTPLPYYQLAFAFLMSLVVLLLYWLLLRFGPRGSWIAFVSYVLLGAIATMQVRFDVLPSLLTFLCILAAERKRWTLAYLALAFGTLLKIYPILLLPALFIAEQRSCGHLPVPREAVTLRTLWQTLTTCKQWRWKNCLLFLIALLGITGIFAALNFEGAVIDQLQYFLQRPMQVESSGSTLLWLAHFFGFPISTNYDFGSINLLSPLGKGISNLSTLALLAGCAYALWLQWRAKMNLTQTAIALLLVFIATGKVFSPQYLIWVLPLIAYAYALDTFWLFHWNVISVLTTYIYIFLYSQTADPHQYVQPLTIPGFFEVVGLRNAFVVFVTLAFLFNWWQVRSPVTQEDRLEAFA
jgi:hypothetical protein